MPANTDLIHAYRHLLRAGLRAVQFSQPSRTTLVQELRDGFRDVGGTFDKERARRTVWFLNAAAQQRGLEHRILKNLCRVAWERRAGVGRTPWRVGRRMEEDRERVGRKRRPDVVAGTQFEHYERTIAMLNDTMGLCLR